MLCVCLCNSVLMLLPLTLSMSCGAEHYILWFIDIIVLYFATFYIYKQIVRHGTEKETAPNIMACVCARLCVAIPYSDIVSIPCSDFVNVSSLCVNGYIRASCIGQYNGIHAGGFAEIRIFPILYVCTQCCKLWTLPAACLLYVYCSIAAIVSSVHSIDKGCKNNTPIFTAIHCVL